MPTYTVYGNKQLKVTDEIIFSIEKHLRTAKNGCGDGAPLLFTSQYGESIEGMKFSKWNVLVPFTLEVEAPQRGGPDGVYCKVIKENIWKSGKISRVKGWYSSDVVFTVNRMLTKNERGGPFTAEEQADPDVILTSLPADSPQNVIAVARRRRHRLRRLLMARTFCQSNASLSFVDPGVANKYRGYVNKLKVKDTDVDVSFISKSRKVKVSSELLPKGYELIEPTDSYRFNQLVSWVKTQVEARKAASAADRCLAVPFTEEDIPF